MIVCAISDLHGKLPDIPKCDVLVIAGDLCPDFGWDAGLSKMRQTEWLAHEYYEWEQRVPAQHILVTPGNHDWVWGFAPVNRSQMFIDQGITIEDKSFWFTPWVSHCGEWNYMAHRDLRRQHFSYIPYRVDLLVSHSPPFKVGDKTKGGELAGCPELRSAIMKKQPRCGVFGHIHEGSRFGRQFRLGGTKLFNVAMWGPQWFPLVVTI